MSTYVELEIQNLLNEDDGNLGNLRHIGERLVQNLEDSPDRLTLDNLNSLSKFLISANEPGLIVDLVLRYIENESFPIPWPYFLEALGMMVERPDDKILSALFEGIREDDSESEASRAQSLYELVELAQWRSNRKYKIHKDFINNKNALIDQLATLRTQQLYEEEKILLQRLLKVYPGDRQILKEAEDHKQRYALEVLQKHSPKSRGAKIDDLGPEESEDNKALEGLMISLHEAAEVHPEMALDFAVAAFMWEQYEAALSLLSYCEEATTSYIWLNLEILLKCRRHIELLNELAKAEIVLAHDSETFFATAYLRAQAYWGLGQKHTALEVLESLLASRPHYRAAGALLSIWSSQ